MAELVVAEDHLDFAAACRRAKELAARYQERTGVERSSKGWAVLVSRTTLLAISPHENEYADNVEDYSSSDDDEYQKQERQSLIEEFRSNQDDWARSDEEGWFYED